MKKTFRKTFNKRKYECESVSALKQMKLMGMLASFEKFGTGTPYQMVSSFANIETKDIELLFNSANLTCEDADGNSIPLGHIAAMEEHFQEIDELVSVVCWVFASTINIKG